MSLKYTWEEITLKIHLREYRVDFEKPFINLGYTSSFLKPHIFFHTFNFRFDMYKEIQNFKF